MKSEKVKEIKKALGSCQKNNCLDCPYFIDEKRCRANDLLLDTINLINELESENKSLQKGVKRLKKRHEETIKKNADECVKKFCETTMYYEQEKLVNENQQLKDRLAELKKKNERLLDSVETVQNNRCVYKCELTKKQLRQFAERLKEKSYPFPCAIGVEYAVPYCKIDETLKEYEK